MTLNEIKEEWAIREGWTSYWEMCFKSPKSFQYYDEEALELYRQYWENVGIDKGLDKAWQILEENRVTVGTDFYGEWYSKPSENGMYADYERINDEIFALREELLKIIKKK